METLRKMCEVCEGRGVYLDNEKSSYLDMCKTCDGYGFSEIEEDKVEKLDLKPACFAIHAINVMNGFYEKKVSRSEFIALTHSELSEALEADRKGDEDNFKEEIADVVIRILDRCGYEHIDIGTEIVKKMEKNRKRGYKHGKRY